MGEKKEEEEGLSLWQSLLTAYSSSRLVGKNNAVAIPTCITCVLEGPLSAYPR